MGTTTRPAATMDCCQNASQDYCRHALHMSLQRCATTICQMPCNAFGSNGYSKQALHSVCTVVWICRSNRRSMLHPVSNGNLHLMFT